MTSMGKIDELLIVLRLFWDLSGQNTYELPKDRGMPYKIRRFIGFEDISTISKNKESAPG